MKMFYCALKPVCFQVSIFMTLTLAANLLAQSNNPIIPVVTISATTPIASSPDSLGVFTVLRAGDTNLTLNVYYRISGTASNGVDYAQISNWVIIPAGTISNAITITPIIPSSVMVTRTVCLQLAPSPLMNPVNYSIGSPDTATVFITAPGVTNLPPFVDLASPTNGQVFSAPTDIPLLAQASALYGNVTNVEFFAGTNDLGHGLPVVLDPLGSGGIAGLVYWLNWQKVPADKYSLTAVVTDDSGLSTTSSPVNITVLPGPPTNHPPVVRITSPPNGSVFWSPVNIPIFAYAADPDGQVTSVEFFSGTNSLGFGQSVAAAPPPLPPGPIQPPILIVVTNYWELVWTNPPLETNLALTARATDDGGLSTTSNPVNISVLPSPPPPTNRPPIVSIVATDPVAIEGTNCWVWPAETNSSPTWAAWPAAVCRFFTNCGPKTATFTVFRSGATNDGLNVSYNLGGTATNGIDFVTLPGWVTIPAGERRSLITIVPIDDGSPDVNKTIILTLTPSTNSPPDYIVGLLRRAAGIIIDNVGPHSVTAMLHGDYFHFSTPGPDAAWFCIERSTDMSNWLPVCTNQVVNGSIDFVDPDAPGNPARFYRVIPLNAPPLE
jgi:hypothetical protein